VSGLELPIHLMRDRAEVFGTVAEQYDRLRPSYPDALVDDLLALRPTRVLDVGAGTGKAARLLAARGLDVLGVEIDAEMAAVARTHGLAVEVGAFETWDAAGRTFDLITCGQAWHWIDPSAGLIKALSVLDPGGWLVPFWNYGQVPESLRAAFDEIYDRIAPHLMRSVAYAASQRGVRIGAWEQDPRLASTQLREYSWRHVYPAADWLALLQTHSDHVLLDVDVRERLLAELGTEIDRHGGLVDLQYTTFAAFAQKARP